jgi:hypothetical protein
MTKVEQFVPTPKYLMTFEYVTPKPLKIRHGI